MALDQLRFLDRRPGRSYTTDAIFKLPGEAEPVDEATQRQISEAARLRFEQERADELAKRDAVSRSVRLRNAQNEVRRLGIDATRELRAIDSQIEILGRKAAQRRAALSTAP